MQATSDHDLLLEFSGEHSDAAFEAVVRRHLDSVHSAALRLTGDPHQSEDIAQGVFVALARQAREVAARVSSGMPLSAWLHVTTRHLAAKTIRTEARRRARERVSLVMSDPATPEADEAWERVAPSLDRGLAALSLPDRQVLFHRFFERRTAREIGEILGIREEAAQKRILRAIERLRLVLAPEARGLTTPALAAALGAFAVQPAPSALAATVTHAVVSGAALAAPAGLSWLSVPLVSQLAMSKSQIAVVGIVVASLALPLGAQRLELRKLRADLRERSALTAVTPVDAPGEAGVLPDPGSPAETVELDRLRQRVDELRSQIAARRRESPPAPVPVPVPGRGPVLLVPGTPVAVTNLVAAGNESPLAAAQTMLALVRDGDLDGAVALWLLPPKERAEVQDRLSGEPEMREELQRHLASEFAGVETLQLLDVELLGERRAIVNLRRTFADQTNRLTMNFGRTRQGWKQIP